MKLSLFLVLWIVSGMAYASEDWFNLSPNQITEVGKVAGSVGGAEAGQLILRFNNSATPGLPNYLVGDVHVTGNKYTPEDNKQILAVLISAFSAGRSIRLCTSEDENGNSQVLHRPYIKAAIMLPQ